MRLEREKVQKIGFWRWTKIGMRKRIQTYTTVDNLTGEITNQYSVFTSGKEPEQPYVKVYIGSGVDVFSRSKTESLILQYIIQQSAPTGRKPEVIVNSHIKREIAEAAECTVGNVEYALKKLIAAHIIIRVAKGTYILNPFVLGRGSWERIHSMRVGIEESPIKPKEKPATTD